MVAQAVARDHVTTLVMVLARAVVMHLAYLVTVRTLVQAVAKEIAMEVVRIPATDTTINENWGILSENTRTIKKTLRYASYRVSILFSDSPHSFY